MMQKFLLKAAIFTSLIFSSTDYYFYNPNIQRGSEPYFHPINTVLNGSFDILGKFSPGFYCAVGESGGLILGLSFNELPFGFGKKYQ
jgi:hypothetical protein